MSESRPPPGPREPSFPPDNPWRVAWRIFSLQGRGDLRFVTLLFCGLGLLLGSVFWTEFFPGWLGFGLAAACVLFFALLIIALTRWEELRQTLLSHAGGPVDRQLRYHPILTMLVLPAPCGLVALFLIALLTDRPGQLGGLLAGGLLMAAGVAATAWLLWRDAGSLDDAGLSLTPPGFTYRVDYSSVIRLDWHPAGGTGADRLTVITPSATARFIGQYERNNDIVYRVLDGVIGPRLEAAQAELEREGRAVLGPLRIYPDRFERPGDAPPVRVPFSLAKSASINRAGRFVVEIPGRHEPLPLLSPSEYPFVPVALRLTGALWRAGETAEADEPEPGAGGSQDEPGAELAN